MGKDTLRWHVLTCPLRSLVAATATEEGKRGQTIAPAATQEQWPKLPDRVREVEGNPDFSNKDIGASQPQLVTEINTGIMCTLNQYTENLHFVSSPLMEDEKMATLSLSDQLPSGQRLSLVPPSQSPYLAGQEPLRVSISSQLRNLLQGFNITNEAQEEAVAIVLNDNLDLGCAVIEHAATDNPLRPPKARANSAAAPYVVAPLVHVAAVVHTAPAATIGSCPLESSTPGFTFTPDQYRQLLSLITPPMPVGS
ncbi:hypothetical protein LOK49_LG03G03236 [Camellia lanceoleosa]|uniref:Uncharacterized protein n=1 Tax=Camellia lanceoleosa TaxID=1840588 RepID=A0ACC0ICR6_9ERIC|nr:hypothetical protein LOK49_LG03G03236 [Camellia lanceoleosa]